MKQPPPIPRCDHPGCENEGGFGFHWGGQERHACREHRAEGQTWLDGVKSAKATCTAEKASSEGRNTKPGQGRLL